MVELMTALGIMAVFVLVIMNAQKQSLTTTQSLKVNNEVNNLIQILTAELSREDVCSQNFLNKSLDQASIASIVNKSGQVIISQNAAYGSEIDIKTISTTHGTGTPSENNLNTNYKMYITVNYQRHKYPFEKTTPPIDKFTVPINAAVAGNPPATPSSASIISCYSDLQTALQLAVQYACQGNTSRYFSPDATYPYGHCEHEVGMVQGASATTVTPSGGGFSCPAGQVLQKVDTSSQKMTFACMPTTGASLTCPTWNYLSGISSTGTAICTDVRTIFPNSGFMVIRSGSLVVQDLSAACSPDKVLTKIDAAGNPVCVNPRLAMTCPTNQYVSSVNADGTVTCSYSSNQNACSAGLYITAIDSAGNVTCSYPTLTPGCSAGQVMNGINSSAAITCVANPP